MDTSDVKSLYKYLIESRKRFLERFRGLGWVEVTRDRGATWGSMQGIFIHILETEDSWLHYDISGKPWPYGDRDPSFFGDFDKMEAYNTELTEKTQKYLSTLTEEELVSEIAFDAGGQVMRSSVGNILIHTFIDEVAHIGELVALMWQLDIQPPYVNYIREHSKIG